MMQGSDKTGGASVDATTVRHCCGDLPAWKIARILEIAPDLAALEAAVAWAGGDDETTPQRHMAPHGSAALVYEILVAGEENGNRDR